MSWLRKLHLRIQALFHKEQLDARMDDDMRSHIEMQTQENIDAGIVTTIIGMAPVKPAEFVVFQISQFVGGTEVEALSGGK